MKWSAWIVSIPLSVLLVACAGPATHSARADAEYRSRVLALGEADAREHGAVYAPAAESSERDLRRWQELQTLLTRYGFPRISVVGHDGAAAAFDVIRHAPVAAQASLLDAAQDAALHGEWDGAWYAQLYDRVQIDVGALQRYGTQFMVGADGVWTLAPLEDAAQVDSRRAALGMHPLQEYLGHIRDSGISVRLSSDKWGDKSGGNR